MILICDFESRHQSYNLYKGAGSCKIVEFMNKYHPDPNISDDFIGDGNQGMLELEKVKS